MGRDVLNGLPGEFTVVRCRHCKLMRTNPRPSAEAMAGFYPADYGPYLGTRISTPRERQRGWFRRLAGPLVRATLVPLYERVFETHGSTVPELPPGNMLEIGSASGSYLKHMQDRGWQVQGVEFSQDAARAAQAQGFRVFAGQLEEAPLVDETMDLVVGWMVLEHLHDPVACLRKLRASSKANAWLVLSVPNAASLEFRVFGPRWYALQVPTHLYHFTPETLEKVLDAAGWELRKVIHQRSLSNLVASLGYCLRDRGLLRLGQRMIDYPERPGLWGNVLFPLAWFFSLFGQTGRMTVWARRR